MDKFNNKIIIASELDFDEEVIYSVELLQKHYDIDNSFIFKYEDIYKELSKFNKYNEKSCSEIFTNLKNTKYVKDDTDNKLTILFVGHNIHLSDNMCGNIKREDVIQTVANIQQLLNQSEIDVKFYSCHLHKNLINMKFDFIKKREIYKNIKLRLNLYASQYHLADNMFYETLKEGKIATVLKKYKGEYFVDKTEYLSKKEVKKYEVITKPIVPVFEAVYDSNNTNIVSKRFAFPEGYLNKKDNKIYITKEELDYTNENYINRITLDRLSKANLDIFEDCINISY